MGGHSEKVAICKPMREASEEINVADTVILNSSLQNCGGDILLFKPRNL